MTQGRVLADTADMEPNPVAAAIHIDQERLIARVLDLECYVDELKRDGDTAIEIAVSEWRTRFQRAMWFACFGWCLAFWSIVGPWIWSMFKGLVWGS